MFSIIIPLYNKAHTIIQTIKSVLGQSYTDFEVIIVDDGSTDAGVSVIKNYTSDSRLRIIHQQNRGVSVARNTGIQEAKGDYIAFLDGDDEWLPEYLQKVIEATEKYPDAGLILSARIDKNKSTGTEKIILPRKNRNTTGFINYFEGPNIFTHISSTVIKRDLLIANFNTWGKFEPGQCYNEDFTFVYKVAMHTKVLYIGTPLLIYNGGVDGQATSVLSNEIRQKDAVLFHNLVISEWLNLDKKPHYFKIFIKYEIRHLISGLIRANKRDEIAWFCLLLNKHYKEFFHALEWNIYCKGKTGSWMLYYIYLTKIRWRMRGFPRV